MIGKVYDAKRLIGRKFEETGEDRQAFGFDVIKGAKGDCLIKVSKLV